MFPRRKEGERERVLEEGTVSHSPQGRKDLSKFRHLGVEEAG